MKNYDNEVTLYILFVIAKTFERKKESQKGKTEKNNKLTLFKRKYKL